MGDDMLELLALLKSKKKKQAKRLICIICERQDLQPDCTDENGYSSLLLAAKIGATDLVESLINAGGNVNQNSPIDGSCPLLWSCMNNFTEVALLLVRHGAVVNVTDQDLNTPLFCAVKHNNERLVQCLLDKGAHDDIGGSRRHIWEIIIRNNRLSIAKLLLSHGYTANDSFKATFSRHRKQKKINATWTPFLLAIRHNLTSMALLLAKSGGHLNLVNCEGLLPLTSAVLHRNLDLIHGLIQNGANMHLGYHKDCWQPFCQHSPLSKACSKGLYKVVDMLLRYQYSKKHFEHLGLLFKSLLTCFDSPNITSRILNLFLSHGNIVINIKDLMNQVILSTQGRSESDEDCIMIPPHFVLLLRAGLPFDAGNNTHCALLTKAMTYSLKKENRWIIQGIFDTNPHLIHNKGIEQMIESLTEAQPTGNSQTKQYKKDAQNRRELRNTIQHYKDEPARLLYLVVANIRSSLFKAHKGVSILNHIESLTEIPYILHRVLRLESHTFRFPSIYHKNVPLINDDHSTSKSGIVEINDSQEENAMDYDQIQETTLLPKWYLDPSIITQWGLNIEESLTKRREKEHLIRRCTTGSSVYLNLNFMYIQMFDDIKHVCLRKRIRESLSDEKDNLNDISNHLEALDTYIHVSSKGSDDPICQLRKIIISFLQMIVADLNLSHDLDFTLLPCGSDHVGNKVNEFDELDFVLLWNIPTLDFTRVQSSDDFIYNVIHEAGKYGALLDKTIKEVVFDKILHIITRYFGLLKNFRVTIETVLPHKRSPGIYIYLSWQCKYNHSHHIEIDLTPILIIPGKTLQDEWIHINLFYSGTSPFNSIVEAVKKAPIVLIPLSRSIDVDETETFVTTQWKMTLNVCDWKLFQMLDRISPNIRKAYRLLKVIRDRTLPREFQCREQKEPFATKIRYSYYLKERQFVSSHVLENIILKEVMEHPEKTYWDYSNGNFLKRIQSCLYKIGENSYHSFLLGKHVEIIPTSNNNEINNIILELVRKDVNRIADIIGGPSIIPRRLDIGRIRESIFIIKMLKTKRGIRPQWKQTDYFLQHYDVADIHRITALSSSGSIYFYKLSNAPHLSLVRTPQFIQFLNVYRWQQYLQAANRQ